MGNRASLCDAGVRGEAVGHVERDSETEATVKDLQPTPWKTPENLVSVRAFLSANESHLLAGWVFSTQERTSTWLCEHEHEHLL